MALVFHTAGGIEVQMANGAWMTSWHTPVMWSLFGPKSSAEDDIPFDLARRGVGD